MKWTKVTLLFIGCGLVGACQNDPHLAAFSWSTNTTPSPGEGRLVWADQLNRLYFNPDRALPDISQMNLVMVRIAPGRFDPAYWRDKHNALVVTPPEALAYGRALVAVQDEQEHYELALLAHDSGGCGNLDPVDLNATLTEGTDEITPTLFHERVKLETIAAMLKQVSKTNITATISDLANKGTRMHTTATGKAIPAELVTTWTNAGDGLANFSVTTSSFNTSDQDNVVARLTGTKDPDTIIIIGAHMDTTHRDGDYENAPGADDDASGIATITEVIRVLAEQNAQFERTVEFHAYGAEEFGRLGSIALASNYAVTGKTVAGMFQIDMNAYSEDPDDQTIFFTREFTNEYLNRVNKDLLHTYLGGDYEEKSLTAGTSDHKSWHQAGYAAVFPFEDPEKFNQALHTSNDTVDTINNTAKSTRFAQLSLAYLSHHGGLVAARDEYDKALADGTPESADSKDLPLAVIDAETTDQYYMAVGTSAQVDRVEACSIDSASAITCTGGRVAYTNLGDQHGRRIFLHEEAIPLSTGDRFRLYGYGPNDELVAIRNVRLTKK